MPVTRSELEWYGSREAPGARSPQSNARLLDGLLRFEVLAKEAKDRGLDRDPQVVRATKQALINRLMETEPTLAVKERDITPQAIREYYDNHASDFIQPERLRVAVILVREKGRLPSILSAARAVPRNDDSRFRELVTRFSEDPASRARGGDPGPIDRSSRSFPPAVVTAAFGLKAVGDLTEPVPGPSGIYIVRLVEKLPAQIRPLSEVAAEIRQRLTSEWGARSIKEWAIKIRAKHRVEVFAERLARPEQSAGTAKP